ncbi:MAG: pantetheine-phosphate adenylyltransferase [Thermodesulfobacteriota bacterium]|nr:pantetheine-phosphate adenylyltransferase [Thermodesulfobacteriota bacterium]
MTTVAVYPGSFDPITNGHLSILTRGLQVFDKIIVAVARNPQKSSLFTEQERVDMIREVLAGKKPDVEVDTFDGLLVDYAKQRKAKVILRGIRAMSDFEYEFQLALMNRRLNRDIQSIFLMTDYKWFYISSTIVKEAASFGGDISGLVPELVHERLKDKYGPNPDGTVKA